MRHIALHIHFQHLIRKRTAWVTSCRHVNSLKLWPLIKLAGLRVWFDKMCSSYSRSQLPSHVTWRNSISLSKHFFFLSFLFFFNFPSELHERWHVVKARHKMNVSVFETSASFSSAVESHRSCITSMLLAHPEGNSHLSGEIAQRFQVNGEIIHVYLFIPLPLPLPLTWWPYY